MWKWIKNHPATIGAWICGVIIGITLLVAISLLVWACVVHFAVIWPFLAGLAVVISVIALEPLINKAKRER